MITREHLLIALALIGLFLRPSPPTSTRYAGGSMENALEALAQGAADTKSTNKRAFDDQYSHWATKGGDGKKALKNAGLVQAAEEAPVVAGLVGIAAATGLRDLAAVALYLLSDDAEHKGDWELCDICLRAIPLVDPHFVDAYLLRAYFLRKSDPDEAERILLRGVKWNPNDWELWNDLAWLHLRSVKGRKPNPKKALQFLGSAVSVKHPYHVLRMYAYVLAHLGEKKVAEEVYQKMLKKPGLSEGDRRLAKRGLEDLQRGYDRLQERIFNKKSQPEPEFHHHHDHDHDDDHDHHHH